MTKMFDIRFVKFPNYKGHVSPVKEHEMIWRSTYLRNPAEASGLGDTKAFNGHKQIEDTLDILIIFQSINGTCLEILKQFLPC